MGHPICIWQAAAEAAHIIVIRSNAVDKLTIVDDEQCWHLAANGASDRSLLELLLRLQLATFYAQFLDYYQQALAKGTGSILFSNPVQCRRIDSKMRLTFLNLSDSFICCVCLIQGSGIWQPSNFKHLLLHFPTESVLRFFVIFVGYFRYLQVGNFKFP